MFKTRVFGIQCRHSGQSTGESAELRKRIGQFQGEHFQFVIVDVVVCCPCSSPLVEVVVVEVFTKPLQSRLNVVVFVDQAGLYVFVQFDVVDAVSEDAAFGDDRPAQPSFLMRIDDGLTRKSGSERGVLIADPHRKLPFAGARGDVRSEGWVADEDLTVLTFREVHSSDERSISLAFHPCFNVLGVSGLVDFTDPYADLPLVGGERVFLVAQPRQFRQSVKHLEGVGTLNTVAWESGHGPGISSPIRPSFRFELENRHARGEPCTLSSQVCASDGPLQVEDVFLAVCGDAENDHTLRHTWEQEIGFLDGPRIGPTVVFYQKFTQRMRGLFPEKTVWSDDSKAPTLLENLEAALDEQPIEVDVAAHGGEARFPIVGDVSQTLTQLFSELTPVLHPSETVLDAEPGRVGENEFRWLFPRPIALKCIAFFYALIKQILHFFSRDLTWRFGSKAHQFVTNGFEEQPSFGAADHEWVHIEELDVGKETSRVLFAALRFGVFVRIGVAADESGVEQSTAASRIGDGQRDAAQRALLFLNSLSFSTVVHVVVLRCFWEVELFNMLSKTWWQVTHQKA